LSAVDLSRIDKVERPAVVKELNEIIGSGLRGLGKTKAQAEMTTLKKGTIMPAHHSSSDPVDGCWIISLQTPALLFDPTFQLVNQPKSNDLENGGGLFAAYAEVWKQLSNDSLMLVRFFAQQQLAGGWYLHRRFQSGKPYNPFVLTDAGSVFVLKAATEKEVEARRWIDEWLSFGLPLPGWAVNERYAREGKLGSHWTNCPYLPENGYGEINVNMSVHFEKRPAEGDYHAI
jgi:hypothetical protein